MADNTSQTQPAEGGRDKAAPKPDRPINQGESAQAPAEGDDDTPGELPGSPRG